MDGTDSSAAAATAALARWLATYGYLPSSTLGRCVDDIIITGIVTGIDNDDDDDDDDTTAIMYLAILDTNPTPIPTITPTITEFGSSPSIPNSRPAPIRPDIPSVPESLYNPNEQLPTTANSSRSRIASCRAT
ncbi:uncharacterized protein K452DRAFT_308028 [Aplosporella prunicola CBS 121167]|uniref:Uncharacterized protein n=1 Tax=Aplosporella prunicola CBS 121167 TaxID=1176127 RepID=A0A6A6BE33_9PEZI|nr:uncharacterized protein K452DRAFT_308028 [Aplosporella prunicola CBS 121167]KAF2142336.1 hypothetical protein K452DRAFT_308028 [Aplosporella prunicola CBS 121167]